MATTTVRLDDEDKALLEMLAQEHGGRSGAIRQALRNLAADKNRQLALAAFLDEWDNESEPLDDNEVTSMVTRYGL